jgi:hypothetical protein
MRPTYRDFFFGFAIALGFACLFYLIQFFGVYNAIFSQKPNIENLSYWDVTFYRSIVEYGYDHSSLNTGFMILFPAIWKLIGGSVIAAVIANTIFFSVGFGILCRTLGENRGQNALLLLTLPSVFFNFVPYTEALFFLLGSVVLYAYVYEKKLLLWGSLFAICLVRITGVLLIPAFLLAEFLGTKRRPFMAALRSVWLHVIPIVLATLLFLVYQYKKTGIWGAYFQTQSTHWEHKFSWPSLPFGNIEGAEHRYHWLNALALFVDAFALGYLLWAIFSFFVRGREANKATIISAFYLAAILATTLLMNPKYGDHTNVMAAHRYTFATPFLMFFLIQMGKEKIRFWHIACIMLGAMGWWYLFDSYADLRQFITVAMLPTLIILAYLLTVRSPRLQWLLIPIIVVNFLAQAHLFQSFITPLYVD